MQNNIQTASIFDLNKMLTTPVNYMALREIAQELSTRLIALYVVTGAQISDADIAQLNEAQITSIMQNLPTDHHRELMMPAMVKRLGALSVRRHKGLIIDAEAA